MCGRTACTLAPDDIVKACTYKDDHGQRKRPMWKDSPGGQNYWQSCNIAPASHTPVLVQSGFDGTKIESTSDRTVIPMKWGLTPSWHRGDPYKVAYETNNCRAEGMLEKKTYKVPMQKGFRCVVLADGYFEWKTTPEGKQPYFFYFPQPEGISYPGEMVKTELKSENDEKMIDQEMQLDERMNDKVLSNGVKEDVLSYRLKEEVLPDKGKQEVIFVKVKQEADTDLGNLDLKEEVLSTESCKPSPKADVKTDKAKNCSMDTTDAAQIKSEIQDSDFSQSISVKGFQTGETKTQEGVDAGEDVPEWTGQQLLTMAGLYDVWTPPDGSPPLYSYSVITVPAAADIDWCHHRMPAILSTEEEIRDWLDPASNNLKKTASLIKQHKGLVFHPVTKAMNNSRYKSPDCVKPVQSGKPKESPSSNMMMNWLKTCSPAKKRKDDKL